MFVNYFRVKLEGQEPALLRIQGSVVEGGLQLLSPHTDDPMERIRFGSTYYGTDKTEVAMLYNNGPEMASFVCVLEEEALGQEVVCGILVLLWCTWFQKHM